MTIARRWREHDPKRKAVAWAAVLALHAVVIWAIVDGTARRAVEAGRRPMDAAVIQEVVIPPPPPPPPPPRVVPPPRRIQLAPPKPLPAPTPPPPAFVPAPEVAPPPPAPAAVAVPAAPVPSPAPAAIAPTAPAAAPPAGPVRQDVGVACPTQVKPDAPRRAVEEGIEGTVKAQALIRGGVVREVKILSGPRIYHQAVREAMLQYKCVSGPGDVLVTQEFVFRIE